MLTLPRNRRLTRDERAAAARELADTLRAEGHYVSPAGWVGTSTAALVLGLQTKTLANWAGLNRGPPRYRIGRATFFSLADLVAELEGQ